MDFLFLFLHALEVMALKLFLFIVSGLVVALGQPAWCAECGLLAAIGGYALFWYAIKDEMSTISRFWLGTLWFGLIQAVQLSWFVSHPYLYIWPVYFILVFICGIQFGFINLFTRPGQIQKIWKILGVAGLWTLLEWSRLYLLSGFSWNPVGLALSNLYARQMSSLGGVYLLSFWVIFVNLLLARALFMAQFQKAWKPFVLWGVMGALPFVAGYFMVLHHDSQIKKSTQKPLSALLVQTAFPIEECLNCSSDDLKVYVMGEWRQILRTLHGHKEGRFDLVVLPEFVVPFGTWMPVFPWNQVKNIFEDLWGEGVALQLPPLEEPWARWSGKEWHVSNAFILQGLSNIFHADMVAGLEDAERKETGIEHYNAAIVFEPWDYKVNTRYHKRVLVPMGEYIPFEFCRELALSYGVGGSFTPGKAAVVHAGKNANYGLSICYEETYGDLMRHNKLNGANVLVNLTSDVWYPNSKLTAQHRDHALFRATEGGLPVLRACNTGVTCAIDSVGREVASLGEEEWKQAALPVRLPLYTYPTLFTYTGDSLIMGFSAVMTLFLLLRRNK